jgi:multisubunit Na+/H+ antiporter MnhB subunit
VVILLVTAASALLSRDLFRAVVQFIAFGLLMSVAWVRLNATDLAMAEAAIGAGLVGALLLDAVAQPSRDPRARELVLPWSAGVLCLGVLTALVWAVLAQPAPSRQLAGMLAASMEETGVAHELTAVLLNFRGYDTFLEISVLAITAFASLALQPPGPEPPALHHVSNRILDALLAWLGPFMLMLGFYLFWAGSKEPGGAFQAGALLAAGGVLLRLSGVALPFLRPGFGLRLGIVAGFCAFLLAAFSGPFIGLSLFAYQPGSAGLVILAVEAVLTVSIGIILLSLFTTTPPAAGPERGHDG